MKYVKNTEETKKLHMSYTEWAKNISPSNFYSCIWEQNVDQVSICNKIYAKD